MTGCSTRFSQIQKKVNLVKIIQIGAVSLFIGGLVAFISAFLAVPQYFGSPSELNLKFYLQHSVSLFMPSYAAVFTLYEFIFLLVSNLFDINIKILSFLLAISNSIVFTSFYFPVNGYIVQIPILAYFLVCSITVFFLYKKNFKKVICELIEFTLLIAFALVINSLNTDRRLFLFFYTLILLILWVLFICQFSFKCIISKATLRIVLKISLILLFSLFFGMLLELLTSGINNSLFLKQRAFFYSVVSFSVFSSICFRKILFEKIEYLLLVLIIPLGMYLAVFDPISTNLVWDDQIHFERTENLSQDRNSVLSYSDVEVSESLCSISLKTETMAEHKKLLDEMEKEDYLLFSGSGTIYLPDHIAYSAGALFSWIAKILRLPFSSRFILGRVANCLLYTFVCFFAIKVSLFHKKKVFLIAMIPTSVFLSANYSCDPWVISFLLLSFSYLFNFYECEKPIDSKDWLLMLLFMLLGVLPKAVYEILFLITLFVPHARFQNKRQEKRLKSIAIILIFVLVLYYCTFPILKSLIKGTGGDIRGGTDVNSAQQILFILTHPFKYISVLFSFLKSYLNVANSSSYLTTFAYLGITKPFVWFVFYFLACMLLFNEVKIKNFNLKNLKTSLIGLFINFITVCLIATALYIDFNPVGSDGIAGCQPRYLIPILFSTFAYIAFVFERKDRPNKVFSGIVLFSSYLFLIYTVHTLIVQSF